MCLPGSALVSDISLGEERAQLMRAFGSGEISLGKFISTVLTY